MTAVTPEISTVPLGGTDHAFPRPPRTIVPLAGLPIAQGLKHPVAASPKLCSCSTRRRGMSGEAT